MLEYFYCPILKALNIAGVDNWEWYGDHQIEDYGYDCENNCWDVSTSGFNTLEEYNEKLKEQLKGKE